MLMLLFFLVPALLFGIFDLAPDLKAGGWRIPAVYIAVMAGAFVLWVCVQRGVELKSPSDIVTDVLNAILPWTKGS